MTAESLGLSMALLDDGRLDGGTAALSAKRYLLWLSPAIVSCVSHCGLVYELYFLAYADARTLYSGLDCVVYAK